MTNSINVFGFEIYYYAIIMVSALLIGIVLAKKEWIRQGYQEDWFYDLVFAIIICGFICARTWYVLFSGQLNWYLSHPLEIINLRAGGLAIHGAIIGGLLSIIYYVKKYKLSFLKVTDIVVVSLIFGQVLGRWGNFFNQEAHGPETTLSFLQSLHLPNFVIDGMKVGNTYYQPTFLYESIWNLIGFILLLFIRKYARNIPGIITAIYLMWYGFIRFFIEILRTDALLAGGFKVAQLASITMFVCGFILLMCVIKKKKEINENCN